MYFQLVIKESSSNGIFKFLAISWAVPVDLLLSVARRESEFDQYAKSSAGALGLMQVMPGTAQEMAKNLKIPFEEESLVTSWKYNVLLGATYLQELSYRYRGNPILIAASYNAGLPMLISGFNIWEAR